MPAIRKRGDAGQRSALSRATSPVSESNTLGESRGDRSLRASCQNCRIKKVRCSGEKPICARCLKTDKDCIYAQSNNAWTCIASLQERIDALERARAASPHRPPEVHKTVFELPTVVRGGNGDSMRLPPDYNLTGQVLNTLLQDTPSSTTAHLDHSLFPPSPAFEQLVEHFLASTNSSYPMLYVPALNTQVDAIRRDVMQPRGDISLVLLVLAVACSTLPRRSSLHSIYRHQDFFSLSLRYWPSSDASGIQRLQLALLKLQYVLYNPSAGNVWELSGVAMRLAVDSGMNHEPPETHPSSFSALELDMRRRLFWICYCYDKIVCTALGRPPALSDDWVTAKYPSLLDDESITDQGFLLGPPSSLKLAAWHRIDLRRLQSEIHQRLYAPAPCVTATEPPPATWFESMMDRITAWRSTVPREAPICDDDWSNLKYHVTAVLLFRPSPGNPTPGQDGLTKAFHHAAAVMRCYRSQYRAEKVNSNWVSMYQLFTAGVTYLNTVWQAQRNDWNIIPSYVDALIDVQVCSNVMEALTTITPGTDVLRDAFQDVSEKILRHLGRKADHQTLPTVSRGSPTLEPINTPNMAPLTEPMDFDNPFASLDANPFDGVLLQPLEDLNANDFWTQAFLSFTTAGDFQPSTE